VNRCNTLNRAEWSFMEKLITIQKETWVLTLRQSVFQWINQIILRYYRFFMFTGHISAGCIIVKMLRPPKITQWQIYINWTVYIKKIYGSKNVYLWSEFNFFTPIFLYLISEDVNSPLYTKDSGRRDCKIVPWAVKKFSMCYAS